ncbi:hypothetical protein HanHA300_Chr14g0547371 [Helianthus annuus]|nr:hypothetical protein HanHA300_Chr14g0547371 [Helianthus annuus]KAJ0487843.1 hypothetical protein HanHA89_Chr14g0594841 [Helianthus annuus]KAJ0661976.1 hypothetical protein HanOQP8_Chr14g0554391 [Helianthus annuus]
MSLIYSYMLYFLPNFSRTMVHAKLLKPSFFKYFLSVHLGRTNGWGVGVSGLLMHVECIFA